ncbi:Spore germination protein YndE [Paraliobacillus sp. PM-2]|uniref:GerAB/ArcD/ProY family transporter n=1 Tax=Paraliobacillus sp. PM-2 TaxID=1462524 RepID=UPI00061BECC6|nr:endospore germination permease [Paraliobacillus sp. PM-2]CQR48303.1 Spore germination protein YndE [Paraliobacillus sp. PM-2]
MLEKGKISALQMTVLLYPTITATAILVLPATTGNFAKQDMWLSPIWASIFGYLSVFIAYLLHHYYPQKTLIQFSEKIVGVIPGKLISFGFLFFLLHTNGLNLRDYGEFVIGNFLPKTPMIVIILSMAFVCAITVYGGLEVMARASQFFFPVFVVLFLFIIILLVPVLNPENIFPILGEGLTPSLKGALIPSQWFNEFILISFFLPYLNRNGKGLKWGIIAVTLVMITLVISNLFSLLLFGDLTPFFTYPFMDAARYISIADFLQHVESIIMALWVTGMFIKISVFYYAVVIGVAQWLDLTNYRPIVFPIGFLLVVVSIWSTPSLQKLIDFSGTTWPFYAFLFQMLIPISLLFIAIIRKKRSK